MGGKIAKSIHEYSFFILILKKKKKKKKTAMRKEQKDLSVLTHLFGRGEIPAARGLAFELPPSHGCGSATRNGSRGETTFIGSVSSIFSFFFLS